MTRRYHSYDSRTDVTELIGKTFTSVERSDDDEELVFTAANGDRYVMCHDQDCCESVGLYDVCGDLSDLVDSPILRASEDSNSKEYPEGIEKPEYTDSFTWTFYRISTIKGTVTLRWLGESNGYYSESVDLYKEPVEVAG